jgi:hypothetical protein
VILMSVLEVQKVLNDCCDRCIESEAYKDALSVFRIRFGDTFGDILACHSDILTVSQI